MTEHLEEKVSLEQLAYEKGINLSLLYKVFAQVYGCLLYTSPVSRNIADHIDSFTDYDFAHLLFSDGTVENAISLDNQLNMRSDYANNLKGS